jgi:molecular chaperone DnaJ
MIDNYDDYYKILGLEKNATEIEIKKAVRKKTIKYHPNKYNVEEEKRKNEEIKLVIEAFKVLSNARNRQIYDSYCSISKYNEYCDKKNEKKADELELI